LTELPGTGERERERERERENLVEQLDGSQGSNADRPDDDRGVDGSGRHSAGKQITYGG
jgi:hypothetical protein